MFCIRKNQLYTLVENEIRELVDNEALKFTREGMPLEELLRQQIDETGSFNDALAVAIRKFTNKTENVEIQVALDLSSLYNCGPQEEILICFEMKKGFRGRISKLSDLVTNIESATHVDCIIRSKKKE